MIKDIVEGGKYCYRYPRPAVTTDCVILANIDGEESVLLIRRGNEPYKDCWALPGGFLNPDETALAGARRELLEETGLEVEDLREIGTFTTPGRDPRGWVITIAFAGRAVGTEVKGGDDAAEARWFPLSALPSLAFDHTEILSRI